MSDLINMKMSFAGKIFPGIPELVPMEYKVLNVIEKNGRIIMLLFNSYMSEPKWTVCMSEHQFYLNNIK
jgi:hypothetical protein